jgi:site-specific DNA-cytosine methylase
MQITAAYDNDPRCVDVYNRNLEPVAQTADLEHWRDLDIPDCDGIIASPPCQDASVANQRVDRGRSSLYVTTARIIAAKRPQWALVENVPGMKNRAEFGEACQVLTDAGYWVASHKMRHDQHGGYTSRERVFLIAAKMMLPTPGIAPNTEGHGVLVRQYFETLKPWDVSKWKIIDRVNAVKGDASFETRNWSNAKIFRMLDQPWFTLFAGKGKTVTRLSGHYYKWSDDLLAVVQGFPSWYKGLTHRMIGNAIPPELTRPWGQILSRAYGPDQQVVSLFCGAGGGDYGLLDGAA